MKVKFLLFPLSLVIALAVSVFWIRPEISSIYLLLSQKEDASRRLENVNAVVANIDALDRNLNENAENEKCVKTYLPNSGIDDRIFDEVNFLARESSLLLVSMGLKSASDENASVDWQGGASLQGASLEAASLGAGSGGLGVAPSGSSGGPIVSSSSSSKTIQSTDVSVSVFGKYEQIKDFLNRVHQANLFQNFLSIKVQSEEKQSLVKEEDGAPSLGVLNATVSVRFAFLPETVISDGMSLDVFKKSAFDFSIVQSLKERVNYTVPPLDISLSGRQNPFFR